MLKFGIFDHLDDNGLPLGEFFEQRLKLIEQIERLGFAGYHLAEHHSTPLGHAASPSVFLASAFARTKTLRMGPLVYVLPLHHPLRRLRRDLHARSSERRPADDGHRPRRRADRASALWRRSEGRAGDVSRSLCRDDGRVRERDRQLRGQVLPVQGLSGAGEAGAEAASADLVRRALTRCDRLGGAAQCECRVARARRRAPRRSPTRYRQEWAALGRAPETLPHIGITRHIVVADTDDEGESDRACAPIRAGRTPIAFLWERSQIRTSC